MRIVIAACCALLLAGCASTTAGSGSRRGSAGAPGGTGAPTGSPSSGPRGGSGVPTGSPSSGPRGGTGAPTGSPSGSAGQQVYFNPTAVAFAAEPGVVLRSPADVARFVAWTRTAALPPHSDGGVIATLRRHPARDRAVVVFGRSVGCDSIATVALARHGHDLRLVPSHVVHHPECFRENWLVAAYAVSPEAVAGDVTLDGRPPSTEWR